MYSNISPLIKFPITLDTYIKQCYVAQVSREMNYESFSFFSSDHCFAICTEFHQYISLYIRIDLLQRT